MEAVGALERIAIRELPVPILPLKKVHDFDFGDGSTLRCT